MLILAIASTGLLLAAWVLLPFDDEIPAPRPGDRRQAKEIRLIRAAIRMYGPVCQLALTFQILLAVGFNAAPDPSGWFAPERRWLWGFCSGVCLTIGLAGAISTMSALDLRSRISSRPRFPSDGSDFLFFHPLRRRNGNLDDRPGDDKRIRARSAEALTSRATAPRGAHRLKGRQQAGSRPAERLVRWNPPPIFCYTCGI